jgi:site-specific recombinase XerD
VTSPVEAIHPEFASLIDSWDLALDADGYARNTLAAYRGALLQLARWMAEEHPGVGPLELQRDHVRAWIVHVRETRSSGTARSWFAGLRHFCRWLVAEGERPDDATAGIKTPAPNDPTTPVLTLDQVRALLATCTGTDFLGRRDAAILLLFVDGGLRMAELAGLRVEDVDVHDRSVYVVGKGSNRSGPRRRRVAVSAKTIQAVDRYLRERRRHPHCARTDLWLGDRGRPTISSEGVDAMLSRRAAAAGITGLHAHVFRHTWASEFRAAGGSEGDLMALGGWRSRTMLDRYGRAVAEDRARDAYRQRALGDRL